MTTVDPFDEAYHTGIDRAVPRPRRSTAAAGLAPSVTSKLSGPVALGGSVIRGRGNSISKGMEIKTVGSIYRRGPAAVMVLADSPIQTPRDLEGKTLAMTAGSAQFQQWPAFCKGAGIDASLGTASGF